MLEMLLGGTEHWKYMEAFKMDLFFRAHEEGMLPSVIELYGTLKTKYQWEQTRGELKVPDWYIESRVLSVVEDYVEPNYHLKRYANGNTTKV